MYVKIDLTTKEFKRLAEALEKDLEGNPENAEEWEYNLLNHIKVYGRQNDHNKHICDFCEKSFTEGGYVSNSMTICKN